MAPSVQRRKVWLTPATRVPSSNAANTPNPLKFAGVPQTNKRSQPLVGRPPYYGNMWRRYCCLISFFFPIVDTCLICEDIAGQSCAMVPRWRVLATFLRPVFAASRVQHISDLHSKFALGSRHMCRSMVDIQSVAAEIRRGKKEEEEDRRKKLQGKNIMPPYYTGW